MAVGTQVRWRITLKTINALRASAERNNRSVGMHAEHILKEYLRNEARAIIAEGLAEQTHPQVDTPPT